MAQFWRRTKNQLTAPAQYIQTTDKVSRPMAVMMSLVIVFVVIACIIGLIFVAIWGYNKITKPANPITGISTGITTDSKGTSTTQSSGNSTTVKPDSSNTATVTTNQPTNVSSSTAPANKQTTPVTSSTVPNTGMGSVIGIFIIASALGALLYRSVLIRKLQ